MYYKFKPEDAFDFARYVGEPVRQHGDELKFTRYCPYCHGGNKDKDTCNIQCDDIDSYEYAVECPDYVKENEDENCKR